MTDLRRLFWHQFTILGSTMGNAAEYQEVRRQLGEGRLRPIVDRTFSLVDVRAAFERLEMGEQLGEGLRGDSRSLTPFPTPI